MKEQNIQSLVRLRLSKLGVINFRNNTGMGWAGKVIKFAIPKQIILMPCDVLIRNARPLHAGLCEGSSDVIGIKPTVITQDMVGQTIGIFVACEVKSKSGRLSEKQVTFDKVINNAGGISFVARCDDDVDENIGA